MSTKRRVSARISFGRALGRLVVAKEVMLGAWREMSEALARMKSELPCPPPEEEPLPEGKKRCVICGDAKDLAEFTVNRKSEDGKDHYCKACQKALRDDTRRHPRCNREVSRVRRVREALESHKQEYPREDEPPLAYGGGPREGDPTPEEIEARKTEVWRRRAVEDKGVFEGHGRHKG